MLEVRMYRVLSALQRFTHEVTADQVLPRECNGDCSVISAILRRATEKGYVSRQLIGRRKYTWKLTPAGIEALREEQSKPH